MCQKCIDKLQAELNNVLPKGMKVEVQVKSAGVNEIMDLVKAKIESEIAENGYEIVPTSEGLPKQFASELLIAFAGKYEVYEDGDGDMIIIGSEEGRKAILVDLDQAIVKKAKELTDYQVLAQTIRLKMTKK